MSVENESKVFEVNGRKYRVTPWSAWTGAERGLRIMKILGPAFEAIPSLAEAIGGTDKQQIEAAVSLVAASQSINPDLTIRTMKELCEGVFSLEKNHKIDVETYFNEFPDDLFMVVFNSARVQLDPFLPASVRASFIAKKASPSPKT